MIKKIILILLFISFYSFGKEVIIVYYTSDSKSIIYREADGTMSGFYPDLLNLIFASKDYELVYRSFGVYNNLLEEIKKGNVADNSVFLEITPTSQREETFIFTRDFMKFDNYYILKKSNLSAYQNEYEFLANPNHSVLTTRNSIAELYIKSYELPAKLLYLEKAVVFSVDSFKEYLKDNENDTKPGRADAMIFSKSKIFAMLFPNGNKENSNTDFVYFKSNYSGRISIAVKRISSNEKNDGGSIQDRQARIIKIQKMIDQKLNILLKHNVIKNLITKYNLYFDVI